MQPHIPSDLASVVACGDLCGDCGCGESTWPSPELSIRKLFIPVCGQSFAGTHTHTRTHTHMMWTQICTHRVTLDESTWACLNMTFNTETKHFLRRI